jgi:hypothetical protein
VKKEAEDIVFLNRRGAMLSRVMVFLIIKDLTAKAGIRKTISRALWTLKAPAGAIRPPCKWLTLGRCPAHCGSGWRKWTLRGV